ncbi:hypothetical protein MATL_G00258480 [Megalops atlanticus]|uniref:Uncharacterized protein n=1 Tax=Megalops atlanticus TaxID=7932 RepID=A0A9D3P8G6_MEGAT|nr:hypothetical protein MATL_G00258480 [Megalops atlanticus]
MLGEATQWIPQSRRDCLRRLTVERQEMEHYQRLDDKMNDAWLVTRAGRRTKMSFHVGPQLSIKCPVGGSGTIKT